jgi:hypothetical protein
MTHKTRGAFSVVVAVLAAMLGSAAVVSAQGLAEAAKKEEARRKAVTKPAPVFTNSSLKPTPGETIPTPPDAKPDQAATAETADAAQPAKEGDGAPAADPKKTPDYWRKRMQDAVAERDNNMLMVDALQSRINGLWADFTARDNPIERQKIAADRQKAIEELDRRTRQKTVLDKAIKDLEDEARRANVPAGWLR